MAHWTKRAIRKKLHFTDEWHDLVAAIRKYGVFADGHALPVRDTGFLAGKGVSVENIMLDDCSIAPDDSWGGQLRLHGCDFLLSLRPFSVSVVYEIR